MSRFINQRLRILADVTKQEINTVIMTEAAWSNDHNEWPKRHPVKLRPWIAEPEFEIEEGGNQPAVVEIDGMFKKPVRVGVAELANNYNCPPFPLLRLAKKRGARPMKLHDALESPLERVNKRRPERPLFELKGDLTYPLPEAS